MVSAEFMDIFGILAFVIILTCGAIVLLENRILKNKKLKGVGLLLILVGILGLIVDLTIVIKNFILK